MPAPSNLEIRKALIKMAKTRRTYSAAWDKQNTAGTLKGDDGLLTGEASRTARLHTEAVDAVAAIAERLRIREVKDRRIAAGEAWEYAATVLDRDVVITFDVDAGARGDELTPASVEGDGEELTPDQAVACLAALKNPTEAPLIERARLECGAGAGREGGGREERRRRAPRRRGARGGARDRALSTHAADAYRMGHPRPKRD